jgi:hypothetical protein
MPLLTYDFTLAANTPARAAEVQANFDAVKALLNGTKLGQDNIQANAIVAGLIAAGAVTTAKIGDSQVTNAKMADDSVGTAELVDLGVTGAKIAPGTIGAGKLALTVLTDELATTDVGIPATWTDYCSVTPVANATYLVLAVVNGHLTTSNGQSNINVRLLMDGAAAETIDEYLVGADANMQGFSIPILTTLTPTTTQPIKLQAQREGTAGITVQKEGTRLVAVRIG